jgi:hypothetical protein
MLEVRYAFAVQIANRMQACGALIGYLLAAAMFPSNSFLVNCLCGPVHSGCR